MRRDQRGLDLRLRFFGCLRLTLDLQLTFAIRDRQQNAAVTCCGNCYVALVTP